MNQVLSESRFSLEDETSMQVALAMLRTRLKELDVPEMLLARLMTISSELSTNVLKYATRGTLFLRQVQSMSGHGLEISVVDEGPGIDDPERALEDHFSSQGTLGLGLPGVKRMSDDFEIESELGKGTRVKATLWL